MKQRTKRPSVAEKVTRRVELKLDGETWPIVVNHNVLIEVEELTGLNVLAGEANLIKPSAKLIRAALYLALKRAGAEYTLEQVGELITPATLVPVQEAILSAWASAMPIEEPADPTPAAAA